VLYMCYNMCYGLFECSFMLKYQIFTDLTCS